MFNLLNESRNAFAFFNVQANSFFTCYKTVVGIYTFSEINPNRILYEVYENVGFSHAYQDLFSLKNNEKKYSRLSSAAVVTGALRVNREFSMTTVDSRYLDFGYLE